jgi:hypothetical protein
VITNLTHEFRFRNIAVGFRAPVADYVHVDFEIHGSLFGRKLHFGVVTGMFDEVLRGRSVGFGRLPAVAAGKAGETFIRQNCGRSGEETEKKSAGAEQHLDCGCDDWGLMEGIWMGDIAGAPPILYLHCQVRRGWEGPQKKGSNHNRNLAVNRVCD